VWVRGLSPPGSNPLLRLTRTATVSLSRSSKTPFLEFQKIKITIIIIVVVINRKELHEAEAVVENGEFG